MNIEEARELLTLLRLAIDTDVSRREIREALTLTGDLPVMSQRERLKRTLYDDSHAFEDDHGGRCPSPCVLWLIPQQSYCATGRADRSRSTHPLGCGHFAALGAG